MCTIDIKDILDGRNYPDAGVVLYDQIVAKIADDEKIVLNMAEVSALPSMFLNTSIGRFIENYGFEKLRERVSFSNIGASQAQRIKEYIQKNRVSE